jgi:hypothetical protein
MTFEVAFKITLQGKNEGLILFVLVYGLVANMTCGTR